jgi:hypothetical protein
MCACDGGVLALAANAACALFVPDYDADAPWSRAAGRYASLQERFTAPRSIGSVASGEDAAALAAWGFAEGYILDASGISKIYPNQPNTSGKRQARCGYQPTHRRFCMQFRTVLAAFPLAAICCAYTAASQPTDGCPSASAYDASRVQGVLSLPYPDLLAQSGLDSARADDVVALTDASVCNELRHAVEQIRADGVPDDARLAFFRSGPLYFVTFSHYRAPTDPVVLDGPRAGILYVFGSDRRIRVRLRA